MPDFERMSLLMALILLTFALAQLLRLPEGEISIQLPGLYIGIELGSRELIALLVSLLAISGTDWVLRSHPHLTETLRIDHWLLPGVTGWAIGMPLFQISINPSWWLGFTLGSLLLILVLFAEYIVVDPADLRYSLAAAGLTAVSFALFLLLVAALEYSGIRLILLLPALSISIFLISLRVLRLHLTGRWAFPEAALIAFFTIQIASPLHYLPVSPVAYGLAVLAPAYSLTQFFINLSVTSSFQKAMREPLVILSLIWISALIIR